MNLLMTRKKMTMPDGFATFALLDGGIDD